MSGHTPTPAPLPWTVGNGGREVWDANRRIVVCLRAQYQQPLGTLSANCDLIVRAVNSHAALVEALRDCLATMGWRTFTDDELRREHALGNEFAPIILRARAAIAAAEKGE